MSILGTTLRLPPTLLLETKSSLSSCSKVPSLKTKIKETYSQKQTVIWTKHFTLFFSKQM